MMNDAPTKDRRLLAATDRVALQGLRNQIARPAYTLGTPKRVAAPLLDLRRSPDGARDRQVGFGADLLVIDEQDGCSFVQVQADGYCGWLDTQELQVTDAPLTHRVSAPATHIYAQPDFKTREIATLSLSARLSVVAFQGRYAQLATGGWVPVQHIANQPATDPATVAQTLLGTPYLWGGNSRFGIDCSGLVQNAMAACGFACPGDSDLQEAAFPLAVGPVQRNDLLFWPGHIAMALDSENMIHATAWKMAVIEENIASAIARISDAGDGELRSIRRPSLVVDMAFP